MSCVDLACDLDRKEITARERVQALEAVRPGWGDGDGPGGIAGLSHECVRESGSWLRYVPRARVPLYALHGWREVPADAPYHWSALMRWNGPGAPSP